MTVPNPTPTIYACTVPVTCEIELSDFFTSDGFSWVRQHAGLVGGGAAASFYGGAAAQFEAAQSWWQTLMSTARIWDFVELPGSGPLSFGSFAFATDSAAGSVLTVPEYVVGKTTQGWFFTSVSTSPTGFSNATAAQSTAQSHWRLVYENAQQAAVARDELPATVPTTAFPTSASAASAVTPAWRSQLTAAVAAIRGGRVKKVVLSRTQEVEFSQPLDVAAVLRKLATNYTNCWTFQVDGLVGATPELLARLSRGLVTSRVLAGTVQITGDDQADLARAGALARSSKDRAEHRYAVDSVTEVLERYAPAINVPDSPSVLHLPNVMHLATDVTAALSGRVSALQLVGDLHPSAAVCGTPTATAAALIAELEEHDRGRYAGPVGWLDHNGDGEWGIALRCARVEPNRAVLYAGCGIMAESEVEAEWLEAEAKLAPMRSALGI